MSNAVNWRWALGVLLIGGACGGGEAAPAGTPAAAEPVQAAQPQPAAQAAAPAEAAAEVFKQRCTPCHGDTGRGDGPAAASLDPKPRDYSDPAWQKTVTDEQLKQVILYGGAAVGKSPVMPSQPDLESKPEVLAGLIRIIRDASKVQ